MAEYINREDLYIDLQNSVVFSVRNERSAEIRGANKVMDRIRCAPAADVLPVTKEELAHLINDTIAYIWGLEARGAAKPEYGYDSRKALLEKLKKFEEEHFPELGCGNGGG